MSNTNSDRTGMTYSKNHPLYGKNMEVTKGGRGGRFDDNASEGKGGRFDD